MKKIVAVLLAIIMISGCGKSTEIMQPTRKEVPPLSQSELTPLAPELKESFYREHPYQTGGIAVLFVAITAALVYGGYKLYKYINDGPASSSQAASGPGNNASQPTG